MLDLPHKITIVEIISLNDHVALPARVAPKILRRFLDWAADTGFMILYLLQGKQHMDAQ